MSKGFISESSIDNFPQILRLILMKAVLFYKCCFDAFY